MYVYGQDRTCSRTMIPARSGCGRDAEATLPGRGVEGVGACSLKRPTTSARRHGRPIRSTLVIGPMAPGGLSLSFVAVAYYRSWSLRCKQRKREKGVCQDRGHLVTVLQSAPFPYLWSVILHGASFSPAQEKAHELSGGCPSGPVDDPCEVAEYAVHTLDIIPLVLDAAGLILTLIQQSVPGAGPGR